MKRYIPKSLHDVSQVMTRGSHAYHVVIVMLTLMEDLAEGYGGAFIIPWQ
jgi:hypothetical protein